MANMRPQFSLLSLLLSLSLSSSLFWSASSHCVSRTSLYAVPLPHPSSPPSSHPVPQSPPRKSNPPVSPSPVTSTPSSPPPTAASSLLKGLPILSAATESLVKSICQGTGHPDLCFTSVQPFLSTASHVDATALLGAAMQAIVEQTKTAREAAANLIAESTTSTIAKGPLNDCLDMYDDVAFSITNTKKALATHDKGTVGSMLSAIVTDFDTCEEGFQDLEVEPLMANYDNTLHNLGSICLDLATVASLM